MRVIAKKILRKYWIKQTDTEEQLKTWYKEASKAVWTSPDVIINISLSNEDKAIKN